MVRIWRYENLPAHAHEGSRERFGNHETVPGVQNPGILQRNVETRHGHAGGPRQKHRPGLDSITRPTWTIDRKCHRPALLYLAAHSQDPSYRATTGRAPDFEEPKFSDHAAGVFPVEAVTAEHVNM